MSEEKVELTESQRQFLDELRVERDHRRWLWKWLKVWGSWIGGGIAVAYTGWDGAVKLIKWLAAKL